MIDIRDIDGLWCDDITFCPDKCGWKDCPRNKENIRDKTVPHSFSVEIPKDCPKKGRREIMRDKETVLSHLRIVHTWASFALENDINFFNELHMKDIMEWMKEAIETIESTNDIVHCSECVHYHAGFNCALLQKPFDKGRDWYCADGRRRKKNA